MRLFFGKISKTFDKKQITEGYYQAPRLSSYFGGLTVGDYSYIIGGDKIQFWRAKEWRIIDGNDRLYFEVVSSDLGIFVNELIALKFLKLTKALLVLSSRSARSRAFFPLELIGDISIENLSSSTFYQNEGIYRSIRLSSQSDIVKDSEDIQLVFKDSLEIVRSDFYDPVVYDLFRDNLKYLNKGAKHKDNTLAKIQNKLGESATFTRSDISLRAFYDAFFCDYNEKDNYFLVGAFWSDSDPEDMTGLFTAEGRWQNGYDDKFTKEVNAIPENAFIAIKAAYVKEKKNSVMMIKARGRVVKNHLDGRNLDVEWEKGFEPFEVDFGGYMTTVKAVTNKDHIYAIWDELDQSKNDEMHSKCLQLLKYKKQIILQGPPGTGKTRLAKELAAQLIGPVVNQHPPLTITDQHITSLLAEGMIINSSAGNATYSITGVSSDRLKTTKSNGTTDETLFKNIRESYQKRIWSDISNNDQRRASAFAKYIFDHISSSASENIHLDGQCKLIQFHPSYNYEDFVRGIVSSPNADGDGILYEAQNRLLMEFAKEALDNYNLSVLAKDKSQELIQSKNDLELFIEHVEDYIANDPQHKYPVSDQVYLFAGDGTRFKYKGDNWVAHSKGLNMKFAELEKIIRAGVTTRAEIKNIAGLEELTRQHATYFFNTIEKYKEFIKRNGAKVATKQVDEKATLKNYVLIIDEINRANLSSVLGELIYALEYRGEEVESMYRVDGSNKLILPKNLYIIGTMNTADRSVGHIDYAIRRRFAFVDVLPEDLSPKLGKEFDKDLFKAVAGLFDHNSHLSAEFESKDVQLGHSYFIVKSKEGATMSMRLEYEIIPILKEYVRDGVLKETAISELENLIATI